MGFYVLFDVDGPLANGFEVSVCIANDVIDYFNEKYRKLKLKRISRDDARRLRELGPSDIRKELNIPWWLIPKIVTEGRKRLGRVIHKFRAYPGVHEAIEELTRQNSYMFGIMSTNSPRNVGLFLDRNGLADHFSGHVYAGVPVLGKGAKMLSILNRERLTPDRLVYVGDEVRDIRAAHSIEVPVISVSWGYQSETALLAEKPTAHVRNPGELVKAIANLEARI